MRFSFVDKKRTSNVFCLFAFGFIVGLAPNAPAKSNSIPLMPPRWTNSYEPEHELEASASSDQRERVSYGLELGTLAQQNSLRNDFLGFRIYWGGRLFMNIPLADRISLRPSLGYYFRYDSNSSASTTDYTFEGGLCGLYTLSQLNSFHWYAGLAQRVDLTLTTAYGYGSSGSNSTDFRYRIGPTTEISIATSAETNLLAGVEGTYAFTNPGRVYLGLTLGFSYTPR